MAFAEAAAFFGEACNLVRGWAGSIDAKVDAIEAEVAELKVIKAF